MLGILVLLVVSWLLLYLFEKKSILALGFLPVGKSADPFVLGFLVTASLCFIVQYLESFLKNSVWVLNGEASGSLLFKSFYWDFKSVLTEELVFRGALLFILIKKLGVKYGILISAIAFGVYHWFSYGVFGSLMPMLFIFVGTGLMGFAWALAFAKTESILMPLGLHLGWNAVHNSIFSKGPLGETLLIQQGGNELADWVSLLNSLTELIVVPILVLIYVTYFAKAENIEFKTKN